MASEPEFPRSRSFRNDSGELGRISQWFRQFAEKNQLPNARALDLELCLNELVTNILDHAYDDSRPREIKITLERKDGEVRATVEDDGRPFNPLDAEKPETARTLESARIGGWGIPIVRAFADEILYERREGGNRVTLVVR